MKVPFHLLLNSISVFFVGTVIMGSLLIVNDLRQVQREEQEQITCGVIGYDYNNELVAQGDNIFGLACATCHAKSMVTDATGPALADMMKHWNYDTLALFSYIQNAAKYMEHHPDSRIIQVHDEYQQVTKPVYKNLTLEDLEAIVAYVIEVTR
ncbi:MAG: cytochrome c [Bacteroidota bacterium]